MAVLLEASAPEVVTPPKKRVSLGTKDKVAAAAPKRSAKKTAAAKPPASKRTAAASASAKPAAKKRARSQDA